MELLNVKLRQSVNVCAEQLGCNRFGQNPNLLQFISPASILLCIFPDNRIVVKKH